MTTLVIFFDIDVALKYNNQFLNIIYHTESLYKTKSNKMCIAIERKATNNRNQESKLIEKLGENHRIVDL